MFVYSIDRSDGLFISSPEALFFFFSLDIDKSVIDSNQSHLWKLSTKSQITKQKTENQHWYIAVRGLFTVFLDRKLFRFKSLLGQNPALRDIPWKRCRMGIPDYQSLRRLFGIRNPLLGGFGGQQQKNKRKAAIPLGRPCHPSLVDITDEKTAT